MRQVHLVVLYEGWRDRRLIQAYLRHRGYRGNVRYEACARGKADGGEKSVRARYPAEVAYIRSYVAKNRSATRWLVVHIDADRYAVAERYKQLNDGLPPKRGRTDADPVCILVPKRNTETWVYHLVHSAEAVSEDDDYKHRVSDDEVRIAGKLLAESDPTVGGGCPPSLKTGFTELRRLPV